jgi:hypothetical protein
LPTFQRYLLLPLSGQVSDGSVNFYQTTRRSNSEDSSLHTRRREPQILLEFPHPKRDFSVAIGLDAYLLLAEIHS